MIPASPTASDLAPLAALFAPNYPAKLREIAERLYLQLAEERDTAALGLPRLAQLALAQTERLSLELGGGGFYMHKGKSYRLSKLYRKIWEEFTGTNLTQLARKYNLTEMRIRQIVDEIREQEKKERQGVLDI
ncbi:MAG: Mor transcription activator family protein [Sulfuricellaceae bacterium]